MKFSLQGLSVFLLLVVSNVFMTFAWYRHLRAQAHAPLWQAVMVSWGIAFVEYWFAVPANRLGMGTFTLPQLKMIQEGTTLVVFALFAIFYMGTKLQLNHLYAAVCLVGAVFFTMRTQG